MAWCTDNFSVILHMLVCLSVCPLAYLVNYTADLHQILLYVLTVVVAQSSSGGISMFLLPVL